MKINVIMSIQLSIFLILFYSGMNDAVEQTTTAVKSKHEEVTEEPKEARITSSSIEMVNICKIMAYSVTAAREAANIIREVMYSERLGKITKENLNDYQTEADRDGQRCIVASLKKFFPDVKIIGEEKDLTYDNLPENWIVKNPEQEIFDMTCPKNYENVEAHRVTLWVDPLDGTYGFVEGQKDHVTTLIGIIVDTQPVAGVIYQPFWKNDVGRAIWGVVGDKIHGLTVGEPPKIDENHPAIIVTTTGNPGVALDEFLEKLKEKHFTIKRVGGSGNKVLYLLEGRAHGFILPSKGPKRWDTAAPEALLKVAGADLTNLYGFHYSYGKNYEINPMDEYGIVASSPKYSHKTLMDTTDEIMLAMRFRLNIANRRQREIREQAKNIQSQNIEPITAT